MHFILVGREIIPASPEEANEYLGRIDLRLVGHHTFPDNVTVSTVFMPISMGFSYPEEEPFLFETAVGEPDTGFDPLNRYVSITEAEAGHRAAVQEIQRRTGQEPEDTRRRIIERGGAH